jgi:hypothetical protein
LSEFGVSSLHMKRLTAWQGEYAVWERNEVTRTAFLKSLVAVAHDTVEYAVSLRGLPSDFHAVNKRYHLARPFLETPYPFAAIRCMRLVEEWLWRPRPHADLAHIVEKGDLGQGALAALIATGSDHISIQPKRDPQTNEYCTPFQIADFLAYEHGLWYARKLTEEQREIRKSFVALNEAIPIKFLKMNRDEMVAHWFSFRTYIRRGLQSNASAAGLPARRKLESMGSE